MIDFYIYNEIGNQYELDKEMLNKELMINTSCPKVNESDDPITQIYNHCFSEAFYYSWSYNRKNKPYYNDLSVSKDEIKYEESIKNHCILSALYTVQYLIHKDTIISAPQLGSRAKGNGHNWINNSGEIQITYKELKFKKATSGGLTDKDTNEKINKNLKEINKIQQNKLDYMERALDVRPNYNEKNLLKNINVSFFLSNFSYKTLLYFNKFNIYGSLNYIDSTPRGNIRNSSIKKFINDYVDYDDKIYFRMEDEENDKENDKENEVIYYETTEIDKMLFFYKKERLLHSDFIKYCYSKKSTNNGLVLAENTNIDILNLCILLPNVYSRSIFAELFSNTSYNDDSHYDNILYLKNLLNLTFPIFEKTFFITLYEYCATIKNNVKTPLDLMNEYLSNYVIKEIYIEEKYEENSLKKSKILNNYIKEAKGSKIKNERSYSIYELLRFAFTENEFNKYDIRNYYKRPDIQIPKYISKFNNQDELKYLKETIYNDYMFYLNCFKFVDDSMKSYRKNFKTDASNKCK